MPLACHVQVNFYLPRLLPQARISACSPSVELQQEDDCEGGSPDCFVNDTITSYLCYGLLASPCPVGIWPHTGGKHCDVPKGAVLYVSQAP